MRVTIRNGDDDGDPGVIAERPTTPSRMASSCSGDHDDKHLTSRAFLKGEDPAVLAKSLLREVGEPESFHRPISYPKLGLA